MDSAIGEGTLEVLDRVAFEKSDLSAKARQRELEGACSTRMTAPLDDGHRLRARVAGRRPRHRRQCIRAASGIVVMTDQLVEAVEDGRRTGARCWRTRSATCAAGTRCASLLQAAGMTAMAAALLGDVSSISGVLSAAPALLEAKNSRDFETEADDFARQWLRTHGIAESNFDAILCRCRRGRQGCGHFRFHLFASGHQSTGALHRGLAAQVR